jgi:DNA-binding winged helix-turn-helix (wHTH) protein/tetratricopeptide (TPR) repeat protein
MGSAVSSGQVFRFGLFEADVARNTLSRSGVRIKIQDQPFRVLILLLERPGEIITREEFRHRLWPEGTFVDFDGSLNAILKKLRAALDDGSDNPRFIETVPRHGYRFIAPVSLEAAPVKSLTSASNVAPKIVEEATANDGTHNKVQSPSLPKAPPTRHLIYGVSTLAILVLILIVLAWYLRSDFSKSQIATPKPAPTTVSILRTSIAVLGFHNLSGKADDGWLATALSEMLSTELAAGEKLRLVSGEDVANLRLSSPWPSHDTLDQKTTSRIGSALNSDLLVLGSYATVGRPDREQLRIDVRLQAARTGEILSEIAEIGSRRDLLQLVSGIGEKLRSRLGVPQLDQPDQVSVAASLPSNRDAARLYALGVVKLREFDALAARDLLQQPCHADPKFALGHAMLARAWNQLGYEQKGKDEAKKALDLSVNLPRAERMLVEGQYYESLSDHEKAASTYRALFELFPDNVEYGLLLAISQDTAGHANQAIETIARLRRSPAPASDDPRIDMAEVRAIHNNKQAQLAMVRTALAKAAAQDKKLVYADARRWECMTLIYGDHPDQGKAPCEDAYNLFLAADNRLGAADALRLMGDGEGAEGHIEAAIAIYEKVLVILRALGEHAKTGVVLNNMAIGLAAEGKLDRAEQLYRQAKYHFEQAGDKRNTGVALANIADILYLRGKLPEAAKVYQQAIEIEASLDRIAPSYAMYRLADLELAQGQIKNAHDLAAQVVEVIGSLPGGPRDLVGAMVVLGDALEAQGDLAGAREQYNRALETRQKLGEHDLVAESQVSLAGFSLEEGHPDQAESLLHPAIAEFEKEKEDPDATGAYTLLSRSLLMQGKLEESRKAIQHAAELGRHSPDPALTLPIAIQNARVELSEANKSGTTPVPISALRELRSTLEKARRLGYYGLECEARLGLGEREMKLNAASGHAQLTALAADARTHGLELLARQAENAIAAAAPSSPSM